MQNAGPRMIRGRSSGKMERAECPEKRAAKPQYRYPKALSDYKLGFRRVYAPAQEPVGVLEARVLFPAFEKALQKRVQCFCLLHRYPQFDAGLSVQVSGLSPGRFCPA